MIMLMDHDPSPMRDPRSQSDGAGAPPLVVSMITDTRPRRTRRGNPVVGPDPGTPGSRRLALLAAVVLAGIAIVWQNLGHDRQQRLIQAPPPGAPAAQAADEPAPGGMTDILARAMLRVRGVLANQPESEKQELVRMVADTESTDADGVRTAIFAAEYLGPDAALERIAEQRADLLARETPPPPDPDDGDGEEVEPLSEADRADIGLIRAELDAVETIYTEGPGALTDDQREQLKTRYGELGAFALTHGEAESRRNDIIGGPWPLLLFGLGVAALVGFGFLAGLGLLVWGMVWFAGRRRAMAMPVPEPGGSVMLEVYALFVGLFAVLAIGSAVAEAHAGEAAMAFVGLFQLGAQWALLLLVLWPLLRGMPVSLWRQALGLHRGRGVGRELGWGLLAYLAFIPVYFAGVAFTVLVMALWNLFRTRVLGVGGEPEPPSNPIVDLVGSGDPFVLVLVFLLATVWAPLAEELVFRGALFRHLRARMHWVAAGLVTALLFAYLHSYGPLMVAPLVVLGFAFAFMREWRGSIIAPMFAHFLHNFTMLVILITAFSIMG